MSLKLNDQSKHEMFGSVEKYFASRLKKGKKKQNFEIFFELILT